MPDADPWRLVGDVINLAGAVERAELALTAVDEAIAATPPEHRFAAQASGAEMAWQLAELRRRLAVAVLAAEVLPVDVRDQTEAAYRERLKRRGVGGVRARAGMAGGSGNQGAGG